MILLKSVISSIMIYIIIYLILLILVKSGKLKVSFKNEEGEIKEFDEKTIEQWCFCWIITLPLAVLNARRNKNE